MSFVSQVRAIVGAVPRATVRRDAMRYLTTAKDCRAAQQATLSRLLSLNADSRFSREHGLHEGLDADAFRSRLPVGQFEDFRPWIEELKLGRHDALLGPRNRLLMFSLSSGTTAESKFIPITEPFLRDYRRGWQMWGILALDDHPGCNSRQIVQICSDFDRYRSIGGTPCGSISGLVSAMQKRIVRSMYCIPTLVAKIDDPEARYYTGLRLSLADPAVGMVTTANPSTLIHLAHLAERRRDELLRDIAEGTLSPEVNVRPELRAALRRWTSRRNPGRARDLAALSDLSGSFLPRDYWRELQVVAVWTGGSAGAYLPSLRRLYGDIPIRDHGLSASEGRMTIPLSDGTCAGLLDVHSHFFEFIPEREYESDHPVVLQAHELQEGESYYVLLTTPSGLYRYDICDVVRCTGFFGTTPLLEFLHKGAHISNLTGEKVTEFQVVRAVRLAAERLGESIEHFTLCPVWGDPPAYELLVEGDEHRDAAGLQRLGEDVEAQLQGLNCEYQEKRSTGRLSPVRVRIVPVGSFAGLQTERLRKSGGTQEQYKHPCLIPDLAFHQRFAPEGETILPLQQPAAARRTRSA